MIWEVHVLDMQNPYKTAVQKPEELLENHTCSWENKKGLLHNLSVSLETGLIRRVIWSSGGLL